MAAPDLLAVDGLVVRYGRVEAVRGVSLRVRPGEIVAMLGANGAGKTTLLNAISGVLPAAGGTVALDGRRVDGLRPWHLCRLGVSHVPEGREIFPGLSVRANLAVVDARGGGPDFSVDDVLALFPRLAERIGQMAGNLSGGEQQMLAIGRGLMTRPRLLLLDEPSLGLSPQFTKTVLGAVAELRTRGVASLLVEQNMRAALKIADRACVIRLGRVVMEGSAAEIAAAPEVREAYLGV